MIKGNKERRLSKEHRLSRALDELEYIDAEATRLMEVPVAEIASRRETIRKHYVRAFDAVQSVIDELRQEGYQCSQHAEDRS